MFNFKFEFINRIKKTLFPFYKNSEIQFIFSKLQEDFPTKPKKAMFVGGCVRKHLSNEKIDDIDIATSLTTDQIKEKFKKTKLKIVDSGIKHGTITIVSKNFKFEITTLRKDVKTDGRHAEIEYTENWQTDSERRDFTINAIYLDNKGNLFDPQLGTIDLKNRNIKFIGDPNKRIEEDYLRIIRFIRFSIEYESEAESSTLEAIKLNLNGVRKISKERILNELIKILKNENFINIINKKNLKEVFLLIFPEFKYFERLNYLKKLQNRLNLNYKIILSILLIDGKDNHEYFAHKYNISNDLRQFLKYTSDNYKTMLENKNFFKNDLKKNIYLIGKENLKILNFLKFSENKKNKLDEYLNIFQRIQSLNIPKFTIDGSYLKKHGMNEGLLMGKTLKILEKEWLKNDFKISREKILEIIKKQLS
ncbi:MAG: poly(A) polymerase [Pelagibacteraceae bacterium]|nr:poly(A) polymerase [Pelagibacteraceae bacterium]|tara:strand:+ start:11656 stop:12918 length:1263 start_codon:yes stop_codon:yes gene_type:complete